MLALVLLLSEIYLNKYKLYLIVDNSKLHLTLYHLLQSFIYLEFNNFEIYLFLYILINFIFRSFSLKM